MYPFALISFEYYQYKDIYYLTDIYTTAYDEFYRITNISHYLLNHYKFDQHLYLVNTIEKCNYNVNNTLLCNHYLQLNYTTTNQIDINDQNITYDINDYIDDDDININNITSIYFNTSHEIDNFLNDHIISLSFNLLHKFHIADFNNDGLLDTFIYKDNNDTFDYLYLNNSDIGYQFNFELLYDDNLSIPKSLVWLIYSTSIKFIDYNNDHYIDIIQILPTYIKIYLNNGNGLFDDIVFIDYNQLHIDNSFIYDHQHIDQAILFYEFLLRFQFIDINYDNFIDIAILPSCTSNYLQVYLMKQQQFITINEIQLTKTSSSSSSCNIYDSLTIKNLIYFQNNYIT